MEKLAMCRICLAEDVRMHLIRRTYLHEMYEAISKMPFETEDTRPVQVCYICCARLQNCYRLKMSCLQSEELFTQMLKNNEMQLREKSRRQSLGIQPVKLMSTGGDAVFSVESVQVKTERLSEDESAEPHDTAPEWNVPLVKVEPVDSDADNAATERDDWPSGWNIPQCILKEAPDEVDADNAATKRDDWPSGWNIPQCILKEAPDEVDAGVAVAATHRLVPQKISFGNIMPSFGNNMPSFGNIMPSFGNIMPIQQTKRKTEHLKSETAEDNSTIINKNVKIRGGKDIMLPPYTCTICKKLFDLKCSLLRHLRLHNEKKPFNCNVCENTFSEKSKLIRHMRSHTGEKPYKCNMCEKSFSQKNTLLNHIRTHTGVKPHDCRLCNRSFSRKCDLVTHIITHTGEKPFKCDVCNKCFNKKGNLKCHIRSHTGEKPYECDVCKRCFSIKSHLVRHNRTHVSNVIPDNSPMAST